MNPFFFVPIIRPRLVIYLAALEYDNSPSIVVLIRSPFRYLLGKVEFRGEGGELGTMVRFEGEG